MAQRHGHHEGYVGANDRAIRRLARRGGVKRLGGASHEEARRALRDFLTDIVGATVEFTQHAGRQTVGVRDVLQALRLRGRALYGFETLPLALAPSGSAPPPPQPPPAKTPLSRFFRQQMASDVRATNLTWIALIDATNGKVWDRKYQLKPWPRVQPHDPNDEGLPLLYGRISKFARLMDPPDGDTGDHVAWRPGVATLRRLFGKQFMSVAQWHKLVSYFVYWINKGPCRCRPNNIGEAYNCAFDPMAVDAMLGWDWAVDPDRMVGGDTSALWNNRIVTMVFANQEDLDAFKRDPVASDVKTDGARKKWGTQKAKLIKGMFIAARPCLPYFNSMQPTTGAPFTHENTLVLYTACHVK